jgi:hypothetical protein
MISIDDSVIDNNSEEYKVVMEKQLTELGALIT